MSKVMPSACYDTNAKKTATNLSANADLLAQARALEINLSMVFEERLAEVVQEAKRKAWLKENRPAFENYNARIGERGSFGDSVRRF